MTAVSFRNVTNAGLATFLAASALASGPLLPTSFAIRHHVSQSAADGSAFESPTVRDTYGGSWIVSERADESRLIVDFGRREMTDIRPDQGSYSVIGFDRFQELRERLSDLEGPPPIAGQKLNADAKSLRVEVREVTGAPSRAGLPEAVRVRPGLRRLEVSRVLSNGQMVRLEAAVDPTVRLSLSALDSLERFETEILSGSNSSGPGALIAAVRRETGGAFPVWTKRSLSAEDANAGWIEDIVTELVTLERFPQELLEIPEGLRRVPHPLEAMVAYAEDEARLRQGQLPTGSN